ncbi:MAG: PD-(D/E)XK nuclease family protein [bacterium]
MANPPRIRLFESTKARDRLDVALAFLSACPRGEEVLAVGPSREAVDDLVRELSAEVGATFGIHRFGFWQLVAYVASAELAAAHLAPATLLGAEAVAARAAFDAAEKRKLPTLEELVDFPGFPSALAATLEELRLSGEDAKRLDAAGEGFAELAALATGYEKEIEGARIADRSALLRLATWAWRRPHHAALRGAPLLLLDVPIASRRARDFVKGLLAGAPSALATAATGDAATKAALLACGATHESAPAEGAGHSLARLRRHLFSEETPEPEEEDESVRFFSAPGEARECVEIARKAFDVARTGVRFDEIAVLLRTPEQYSAHLETAFRRAEIPGYFARGTRRPDPAGRAFLALLACKSERLSAKRFAEYLSFAQVPDPADDGGPPAVGEVWVASKEETLAPRGGGAQLSIFDVSPPPAVASRATAPAAIGPTSTDLSNASAPTAGADAAAVDGALRAPWKWEQYLVEAAVIGGRDRWKRRLSGFERELSKKRDEVSAEEGESPRWAALERELANLGHLERFALPVIDALAALPHEAPWGEWLDLLERLAPSVLGRPEHVLDVLAEMRPMSAIGPVTVDEVRGVLHERLSNLEEDPPDVRFGRVFVATPEAARGRSFKVVFVPGLAERVFPQRPREDPLLPDARRRRLADAAASSDDGAGLRLQDDRANDERLRLRLAIGAASERVVLSYPRLDVREARPRVPSFYGLDVARAVRGVLPDHEKLVQDAADEARAHLAWPAPEDPERSIDAVERDLAVLAPLLARGDVAEVRGRARWLFEVSEPLQRSLRARWIRWRFKQWRPEDGIVRVDGAVGDALATHAPGARPYSATALERYAVCPYRFLLDAIHRLAPREEVAPLVQLDPLTKGSIVHAMQADAMRALEEADLLPVTPANLRNATKVLDETIERVEREEREDLAPAILRVWQDEIARIRADLRIWLRKMAEAGGGWKPTHFELAFGMERTKRSDRRSVREPAVFGAWKLRGAIDLVEEAPDGLRRVTDHKTGAVRAPVGVMVGGGETLQPVLYALAVESILGGKVSEGRLWYCTSRGDFAVRSVPMTDFARHYAGVVLETIGDAIERGVFPPAPREGACGTCDFRRVCGPFEETRARRKDRALLEKLTELRRLP